MLNKVAAFIAENHLLIPGGTYLLGLSGGADSVCLLRVLLELGYRVEAAHCNFQLRGDESQRDEQFVQQLCQRLSVPLHLAHFDTRSFARLNGISIEMAARNLRYHYFEQLRQDLGVAGVCVAHHADDAVETLLMNLVRGTGIHGLTGIRPKNRYVSRPLLCVSRQEVLDFLDSIGQDYITDSSNLVPDVVRNRMRLEVLPLLRQLNPMVSANIAQTACYVAEAEKVYDSAMESARGRLLQPGGISIDELMQEPSPEATLFEILRSLQFTPDVISQVYASLQSPQTGRRFLSPAYEVAIDRGRLLVDSVQEQPQRRTLRMPEPGCYIYDERHNQRIDIRIEEGARVIKRIQRVSLDADKVSFPLTIRPWEEGDRFVPYGMKGSKLVSDFLTDRKLSLFEKRRQLVMTDATGAIAWVLNQRVSHLYRVTEETKRTMIIESSILL